MICDDDKHDWHHVYDKDGPCDKRCNICFVFWSDLILRDIKIVVAKVAKRSSLPEGGI